MSARAIHDQLQEWGFSDEHAISLSGIDVEELTDHEPLSDIPGELAPWVIGQATVDLDAFMQAVHGYVVDHEIRAPLELADVFALPLTDDDRPIPLYCKDCGKTAPQHDYVRNPVTGKNERWPIDIVADVGWPS